MNGERLEALTAEELAILAHELRSPVAALSNLSEVAAQIDWIPSGPDAVEHRLEVVRAYVGLARAAVEDIARLCGQAHGDDVAVGALARVRLPDLLNVATLGVEPGATVLTIADSIEIECDPTRLRQALSNILANGVRHGERVEIHARAARGDVVIEIHDDGPGVPDGLDVFEKGVSGAGSSGYGLWVARSIVEAHGGTLELVRDDGPGACFRIVLPLAPASA